MGNWEANIRKVVPYVPGEQPKEQDIIKLNTNENPYPPAPEVLNKQVELENLRLYPDPAATKLVDAIAEYHGVDKNQVFVGVGSDDVLAMSFMTFSIRESRFSSRILHIPSTMCGQICSGFHMRRSRSMRTSVSKRPIIMGKMEALYSRIRMHQPESQSRLNLCVTS